MNFKYHRRKGFALMEVVIALVVIGTLLTALLALQSQVFQRVIASTLKVERFYKIRDVFTLMRINPLDKEKNSWEKTLEDPTVKLSYQRGPVKKGSELERFAGLIREQASGTWNEWAKERECVLVRYQFDVPPKEKKDVSS